MKIDATTRLSYKVELRPNQTFDNDYKMTLEERMKKHLGKDFRLSIEGAGGVFIKLSSTPADDFATAEQPVLAALNAIVPPLAPHTALGLLLSPPSETCIYVTSSC